MYTDTLLFIVGATCAAIALSFAAYLIVSHKRSKVYRSVLQQETEYTDTFITSSWLTRGLESTAADEDGTHVKTAFTSLIAEDAVTDLSDSESAEAFDFDTSALEGRYVIRKEIHGGGMSRVFLADSAKLGNQWIVKFIPNHIGELANEENILKLLNHISLPKIIDIFRDEKGVYLVQSFIEGYSLNKVLETGQKINQTLILEWAEQLAQVLNYLHRLEPHPIYHYDLKPSNIMVTHDNRLVLIDFGISKRFGEDDTPIIGVTYKYAAPEQLKRSISDKHRPLIESRFGELPAERMTWNPDARTDIFSLGVILFELAVGQIPTVQNIKTLKDVVSHELCEIISKCLNIEPAGRYQSAGELLMDLQKNKGSKIKMARTLFMRKLASVSCAFTILASGGSLTGGYYIYGQENAALLGVAPEFVTVSLQQSSELIIEKLMPSGNIVLLDNSRVRWSFSHDNIAQIDGNRISGMNLGETVFSGRYRNKEITLNVRVVEPLDGMVDISQHYRPGHIVKLFAGTTERDFIDGTLADAEFVSPESIAVADDGTIYISDSGYLRRIRGNQVDSINIDPFYMMPRIVRCFMNEVFILTHEWEDDDGYYYGITRLNNNTAEALYMTNAMFTAIEDFTFSVNGLIHFIERNAGIGATFLKTLDPNDTDDIYTLCELPDGTSSLTIDERGVIYLANPETGVIQIWRDGTLSYFAGVENERAFIDGAAPLFYMPQVVKYSDGYLYVWDFNVLRRISIEGGVAAESITLAGEASPTFDLDIAQARQAAEDIILPNSRLTDFVILENGVLLTDPKRGVIWRAEN